MSNKTGALYSGIYPCPLRVETYFRRSMTREDFIRPRPSRYRAHGGVAAAHGEGDPVPTSVRCTELQAFAVRDIPIHGFYVYTYICRVYIYVHMLIQFRSNFPFNVLQPRKRTVNRQEMTYLFVHCCTMPRSLDDWEASPEISLERPRPWHNEAFGLVCSVLSWGPLACLR